MTEATIGINVPTDIRRIPALAKAIVRFLDIHGNKPARDAPLLFGGVGGDGSADERWGTYKARGAAGFGSAAAETTEAATQLLGLERRQVFRLLKAYRTEGTAGLISKRENFFSKMTPLTHPPRGLFLRRRPADINACLAEHNTNPKLFPWTKSADAILAKLDRLPVPSV